MIAVLLCAAVCAGAVQDPVRVTAALSAQRINVGGTTTLQVTVETRGAVPEEIRVPALSRDLEILGTSDFTQTQITVPGGRTRATRREIVIVARSPGVYRIPPIVVRVAGMTYRTAPLDLIVRSGALMPGDRPVSSSSSLRVTLFPDTVYVGEQVLLHAEATFAEEMRSRQSRPATFDPPAPTGFWIQDLPDPISVTLRVREGRTVETQTYRRAYFPLAAGTYHFPPARLHYEVRRGFLYAPETRELVSDSVPLVVLPVPGAGRPATYTGAVGRLELRAGVAPARLRAGDATVLTVEVEGTGNVKALPEPHLPAVRGAEVFPPTQDSRVEVNDDRVGGMKRFRWMIVPENAGTLVIPPVEYAVFDPELRSYVVLRSDTLRVEVAPVAVAAASDTSLRPLRSRAGADSLGWVRSPAFVLAQLAPLLLLAGAASVRRRRSLPPGPRDEAAELVHQLDALRVHAEPAQLLHELERIAREAVARVAGGDGEPIAALRAQKRPAAAAELDSLLRELQRLRFAPAEPFDAGRLIDRVQAFIALVAPRGRFRRRGALVLAALALPAALVASRTTPEDVFITAVQHYERGEYAAAARAFHDYARSAPRDAAGWYDLGLASYRADDSGRATWAWLRAVKVAPRAADARHNLRAIGAAAALERIQPIDWLNPAERTLIAAAAWWLLVLGGTLALTRPRPRWGAVVPGALLLTLIGITAAATATAPTLITPMGDGARLYAAPTTRETALGDLPAGTVARLLERRADWLLVRSPEGRDAWVERRAVAAP